jgi:hypothetical protein
VLLVPAIASAEAQAPVQANPPARQQAAPQQQPPPQQAAPPPAQPAQPATKRPPPPPPAKRQDPPRKAPRPRRFTRTDLLACGDRAANAVPDLKLSSELASELHPAPPTTRHARDLATALASLRTRTVAERAHELQQLQASLQPGDRTSPGFVKAVRDAIALEAGANPTDAARADLVEIAAFAGLAAEANDIATRISDPQIRAAAEAKVAAELALSDPNRGADLARQALQRAPRDATVRTFATAALARAGQAAAASELGAVAVTDVAIGLRGDPVALASWWTGLDDENRARLIASVLRDVDDRGDAGFLGPLCTNP